MSEEIERSVELIERLLGNPDLRRRFRADPASVLAEAGLPELAAGLGHAEPALVALEMRESRSSLAGVMVAAAAEGVDVAQSAVHAAPALARAARDALEHLGDRGHPHDAPPAARHHESAPSGPSSASVAADLTAPQRSPQLQPPEATAAPAPTPAAAPAREAPTPTAAPPPTPASTPTPTPAGHAVPRHRVRPPAEGARLDLSPAPAPTPAPDSPGGPYPGDAASPQALAAWMGARAQAAGLPPELPVMAALTESGLHNLSYGDRDSVGFFQMRTGIWDEGAYAGYPDHPELQLQWFIDHALAVRNENPALAQAPDAWGVWIADIEQPAAEYRGRYQLQLGTAQELLRAAGPGAGGGDGAPAQEVGTAAASGAVTEAAVPSAPPPPPPGEGALKLAMSLLSGSSAGGAAPQDSGSLVALAYGRQGIALPPAPVQQFDLGIPVARASLRPGDVLFLTGSDGQIDQEGIYAGGGHFVTVSPHDGAVELATLDDPQFTHAFVGGRRFTIEALENPGRYARPLPTIQPVSAGAAGSGAAAPTGSGSSPAPDGSPAPSS